MSETQKRTVSRRSVAKAAAWSVPAVAVVAAAPAYAASPGATFDVAIATDCSFTLLNQGGNKRFVITAQTGDVPAGSIFELTGAGVLGLQVGGQFSGLQVVGVVGNTAQLVLGTTLTEGSQVFVDLSPAVLDLSVVVQFTLSYLSSPSGTESGPGANVANLSLIGVGLGPLDVLTVCTGP